LNSSVKDIKRIGVLSIILSVFFFILLAVSVLFIFLIVRAINKAEGWIVIFIIIFGIVLILILGLVGIISLILGVLNLSTGITVMKSSTSIDTIYNRKGRIKFSIFVLRLTSVVLIIAGIVMILVAIKSSEWMFLVFAGIAILIGVLSMVLVNKSVPAFKEIIKMKEEAN